MSQTHPDRRRSRLDPAGSPGYRAARSLPVGVVPDPAGPAGAFLAARARFLAGERLDMRALAASLPTSRPTLYKWLGPREQLLGDILFGLSDGVFERALSETAQLTGPDRLLAVFRRHVSAIVHDRALGAFLRQETQAAVRILTARHGLVKPRTVQRVAELYRAEQRAGHFAPRADVETLAFAVVSLAEGFIYDDEAGAVRSDVERASAVVALLLAPGPESRGAVADRAAAG